MGVQEFIAVAGLLVGASESRKARRATSRQREAERNISVIKQRREKRNQLRQARAARAEVIAQGVGQGGAVAAPSPPVSGAVGGIESQYAYNLSFLDQVSQQNIFAFNASQQASVFQSRASTATSIASTAAKFID